MTASEWIYDSIGNPDERIAVIDIGSNSVRLVVYDRLDRLPLSLFNEKVLCGLGRNLEKDGLLHPAGRLEALQALARFAALIKAMNVSQVIPLATASLRDARDGADFIEQVAAQTGLHIQIIPGAEEARLSALGVISGMPDIDGIAGDLGGGSLELIGISEQKVQSTISLPIGPLRFLKPRTESKLVEKTVDDALSRTEWLQAYHQRDFVAVGGAWRALARLHIDQTGHPLHIVHHYTMSCDSAWNFMDLMARQSRSSVEKMGGFSRRRAESLPFAAHIMRCIIEYIQPCRVVFSAYGLREGVLFDQLSLDQKAQDPLISGCRVIASRNQRFMPIVDDLFQWTAPLFPQEIASLRRLRLASCLLGDFCWAEHPDYRARHAFMRILRLPFVGVSHEDRVFLALVALYRYGGNEDRETNPVTLLLSQSLRDQARLLGAALRLGLSLTGGATILLGHTRLIWSGKQLTCQFSDTPIMHTEMVAKRISNLEHASGLLMRRMD